MREGASALVTIRVPYFASNGRRWGLSRRRTSRDVPDIVVPYITTRSSRHRARGHVVAHSTHITNVFADDGTDVGKEDRRARPCTPPMNDRSEFLARRREFRAVKRGCFYRARARARATRRSISHVFYCVNGLALLANQLASLAFNTSLFTCQLFLSLRRRPILSAMSLCRRRCQTLPYDFARLRARENERTDGRICTTYV